MGTGSGVLAMFAAKLGFRNILALDTDPVAVEVALDNVSTNGLVHYIDVRHESLNAMDTGFSLILANLSAPLHQNLAGELKRHLKREGLLVASGLLTGEADVVLRSFFGEGLELVRERKKNDWACFILKRAS